MSSGSVLTAVTVACILSFITSTSSAQPPLPDIAAAQDRGIVVLSWTCPYDKIKLITAMRSSDSVRNFTFIGNVKNVEKGPQAFVDGHLLPGRNYYKLRIIFQSGLTWHSNHCRVDVDSISVTQTSTRPPNEELQNFTVTEKTGKDSTNHIEVPIVASPSGPVGDVTVAVDEEVNKDYGVAAKPKKHITLTFGEPDENLYLIIKSIYITTDPVSNHVLLTLPEDVRKHTYGLRFFDLKDHLIFEAPRINASKAILDRRNFQHKGVYRFVLQKDGLHLESGYIKVD